MQRTLVTIVALSGMAWSAQGAAISLEWDALSGSDHPVLQVGEHAILNVRLDLASDDDFTDTFGWVEGVEVTISNTSSSTPTPRFDIVGLSPDFFAGPGYTYDRSSMPAIPFSPALGYRLDQVWDGTDPISGPTSIILDQIEIVGLSPGENQLYLGHDIFCPGPPCEPHDALMYDAMGEQVEFGPRYGAYYAGYWSLDAGRPNIIIGKMYIPAEPLLLTVVPEPATLIMTGLAFVALIQRRFPRRAQCVQLNAG